MKRKILSVILAGALMVSAGTGVFAAEAGDADLFAEGFESTTAASGGAVDTATVRTGGASYVITEDGTDVKLEIPMADAAEGMAGKHIVVEAWYHIEGTVTPYAVSDEGVESGTQVRMAYYKDDEAVESFTGLLKYVYAMENTVYPNADTTGWHRIRIAGIPQDEATEEATADYSDNTLIIGLLGAEEGVKLYVDDVRVFETDNIVDMVSKGNSDFDTYTASGINGWTLWDTDPADTATYRGDVEYSKTYATTGEYGIKLTRQNIAGAFGLRNNVCLEDFGVFEGTRLANGIDSFAEYGTGENFTAMKIRAYCMRGKDMTEPAWYAEKQSKTTYDVFAVGSATSGTLTVGRGNYSASMTASASYVYLDSFTLRVVDNGLAGLKENYNTTGGNKQNYCTDVKELSHGDVVYPYAVFAEEQTTPTMIMVARYKMKDNTTTLDDISVQSFATYSANNFDTNNTAATQTTAITVPAEGEYTYKVMVWSGDSMAAIVPTAMYTVK